MIPDLCNLSHEVLATDAFNVDWTKDTDQKTEWALREQRNIMIRRELQSGQPVAFKSGGNSLAPLIKCGDICEHYPVSDDADVGVSENPSERERERGNVSGSKVLGCRNAWSGEVHKEAESNAT